MRALLILLCAAPAFAQTCKLPATASGDVDAKIPILAETDGANVTYLLPDKGITLTHGGEFGGDSKSALVFSCKPGTYRVWALSAKANIISPVAECVVTIGGAVPPAPPVPPVPPDVPVKVPDVVGKDFATAKAALEKIGLGVLTIGDRAGVVASQAPLAGSTATPGSAVTLIMAQAPAKPPKPEKPPEKPAKARPAVGEKTDEFRPQSPPGMAWGPGVPFPAGMERYERDGFTQLLHVGRDSEPLASKVSGERLPEQFRVSGGMEGLTGWRSTKYRLFPAPPMDGVARIALAGGVKLPGLVRTYPDGSQFHDVLTNADGKVFEHRRRVLEGDRWTNAVLFRDSDAAPEGYHELGLKACAACHRNPGSGEVGKPLIAGGSQVFSDGLAWNLLRK